MKKRDLKKLALMGLTSGMLVATQSVQAESQMQPANEISGAASEADLLSQLTPEGQQLYQSLDAEGQLLARLVVGRGCGCGEGQGKLQKGAVHGCGRGSCGGIISDNYDGGQYYGGPGNHGCNGSSQCGGGPGYPRDGGYQQGGTNTPPPGGPAGQPGQPSQNRNRSMPQFENQPQYQNNPPGKTSAYRSSQSGRYLADDDIGGTKNTQGDGGYQQGGMNTPPSGGPAGQPGQPKTQPQYPPSKASAYRSPESGRYLADDEFGGSKSTQEFGGAKSSSSTVQSALTETELKAKLNADSKKLYEGLSPEGKKLALKLANQSCKGQNDCKGLNSCKGDDHTCAGQGGCKGTSPGKFADKNQAVKVASMKEKRNNASKNY